MVEPREISAASRHPDNQPGTSRNTGVLVFLAITFGGSWLCMLGAWLAGLSLVNPLVQLPFAVMPAIAAVVVRAWVTKEGFADAGLRPRLRTAWPHYLVAWLGPLVIAAATVALATALGLCRPDLSLLDGLVPGLPGWAVVPLLLGVVVLLTPVYWGEEFGWTSYLRPRVASGRPLVSVLVTALIWALWHYPLAFLGYISFANTAVGLLVWTVSFCCQEILLATLYVHSGTVWVASLAHAGNNMVLSLLVGLLLGDGGGLDSTTLTWLPAVPMALLGGWIVLGRRLTPRAAAAPAGTGQPVGEGVQPTPGQRPARDQAIRGSNV
ncbi:CPBP family intramembrane glutamic endopeptidase [Goodfellowiella coeruleoviolacea]|uniref:Membrane protease YdiL, CAAX protease family n=1 Tax=Goodfellowiella coeruleoviolacea TaxID=334858 RepID=A0AAE3KEJ6_9PSEU|nr:CPBP family intramembrane glutamic endopeptidase [Goodfellowiella coeruleoviolacea]MCP2163444.1 Membrane protease YdiL, CAAX protease family [Goodfellowiella coeruleoviolacea]